MKFKHFETESGKTIKTAQFDGYSVAERLLEGLMFQVDIQDGNMNVYVKPQDQEFFDQFNTTKWLEKAKEFAEKNDIFEDPITGEDCWAVSIDNLDKVSKSLDILEEDNKTETEEVKELVIGKYKPKRKFLNFVTGLQGRIRLLNNVAFIKGEQLSGMLEGSIFKITICDEGTINFEEMDTTFSTPEMIQRFIDDIDDRDVTGYTQKFVVAGLNFQDEDAKPCYLEVEHKKPIDMLFSLFDKENQKQTDVSESGMSILNALFSSETDEELKREFEGESDEEIIESIPEIKETASQRYMRESFEKMNAEKVEELKNRIEKTEKEISKLKMDVKQAESRIVSSSDDLKVLNSRLISLQPKESPIGYDFSVSTENKTGIDPDENLVAVVEKIAPILKLNTPVVIQMLTKGYYTIKIQKQGQVDESKSVDREVYQKINKIDLLGKVTMISPTEFEYRGDMTWHQLVDKMIRMGFEQNPEFDRVSGSNSYESKEEEKTQDVTDMKQDILKMAEEIGIKDVAKQHIENIENDTKFKDFITFNEPTDIIIFGDNDDGNATNSFDINDDETSFSISYNGKSRTLTSGGFASLMTLAEYKDYLNRNHKSMVEHGIADMIEGVLVTNFKGTIGIAAVKENGEYTSDFDLTDFILHQECSEGDYFQDVMVNIPGDVNVFPLNDDMSLPINIIRDIKIETIIK